MKITLDCPFAKYGEEMRIFCKKAGSLCGHAFFKRCKGWWALSPDAAKCPLRKEINDEKHTAASSGSHQI